MGLVKWLRNKVLGWGLRLRGQLVFGNGVGAEEEGDLISDELSFVGEAQPQLRFQLLDDAVQRSHGVRV